MSLLTLSLSRVTLIDFTLSNASRFYSSMGNPTGVKGLKRPLLDCATQTILCTLPSANSLARTVTSLKKHCARYGIPRMIVSDGGSQFTSQEFKLFVDNWGITHMTSSPMLMAEQNQRLRL